MSFSDHLNDTGIGKPVEVFSTSAGFTHAGLPLDAAFNPAFTITSKGTMLAFCEGRLGSSHDDAPKTVLMNRSFDMGCTWEGMRALTLPGCHFGPRPYIIKKDGVEKICVLTVYSRFHLRELYPDESKWKELFGIDAAKLHPQAVSIAIRLVSEDDGETWKTDAMLGNRDPFLHPEVGEQWAGFGDFTGTVETIESGPHVGRMVVAISATGLDPMPERTPGNMRELDKLGSAIMYSDNGKEWKIGGVIADRRGNEAAATPVGPQGDIVILRRPNGFSEEDLKNYHKIIGYRLLHTSKDGGETWSAPVFPEGLPHLKQNGRRYDHQCLPSLCAWDNTLLTAAPSAIEPESGNGLRKRGIIGFSDDKGVTWRHRLIDEDDFSYATMQRIGDEGVIVMFSRGGHGHHGSFLRAFTMDWLREA